MRSYRWYEFFLIDTRARWRSFWIALVLGSVAGGISLAAGDNINTNVATALLFASVTFWIKALFYVRRQRELVVAQWPTRRSIWLPMTAAAGFAISIVALKRTMAHMTRQIELTLQTAANDPANFHRVEQILQRADQQGVTLSSAAIKKAGSTLISAAESGVRADSAWDGALHLANYYSRTHLQFVKASLSRWEPWIEDVTLKVDPFNPRHRVYQVGRSVPVPQAAVLTYMDQPPVLLRGNSGPEFIGVEASVIFLDDAHWKNVVVRNTTLRYSGRYLYLHNVYLINCSYDIEHNQNGARLLQAVLGGMPMNIELAATH